MMLRFTKAQTAKLHRNWQAMQDARATGAAFDPEPVVKAFTPDDVPLSFHPAATRVLGLVTPRSVG